MRVLALFFPRLGIQLARRAHPELAGKPLGLVSGEGDDGLVSGASVETTADGVEVGMTVLQARQRCPAITLGPDNARACIDQLEALSSILKTRTTAHVAIMSRNVVVLSLAGLESRFFDEGTAARSILGLARNWSGLDIRAAVASTPEEAVCAARTARRFPILCAETPNPEAKLPAYEPVTVSFASEQELTAEVASGRLVRMLASVQPIIETYAQSYRSVRVEIERGAYRSVLELRTPGLLHTAAEALELIRGRVTANELGGATAIRVTLASPGPSVAVQPWRAHVATVHQLSAPAVPIQRRLLRAS